MSPADLRQMIAELPPGKRVLVLMIEDVAPSDGGPSNVRDEAHELVTDSRGSAATVAPSPSTPLEIARLALTRGPDAELKPKEWVALLDGSVSERELMRAISAGALDSRERGCGRDHKARVISPVEMVKYLETREEGLRFRGSRPEWFSDVVRETPYAA